ncbi:hypothetical protein QFC21_002230 [Naganishia friedmannii]|uniref:Uncharacterized protein n=1 Tax=Naganishia friedmannii TaxID=89922 RepID=A0ACC2VX61_9TREE|nr:hypothetical protein QFC21_002230 [Naganishia friedmannii]
MSSTSSPVLPHALDLPIFRYLKDKRVVLASSSRHRKERLEVSGLNPEVIPSTFPKNLPHEDYANAPSAYPVATAMEVYHRLIAKDNKNAPGLIISGDTVVIFHPPAPAAGDINDCTTVNGNAFARLIMSNKFNQEIQDFGKGHNKGKGNNNREALTDEKVQPSRSSRNQWTRMSRQYKTLIELNGKKCEIVTGVTIVYPTTTDPGYELRYKTGSLSIAVSTLVEFNNNSPELNKAYVEKGEGGTRCGGFSTRGMGGVLIKSVQGDYDNVTGFPTSAFWRWITRLYEEGAFSE